MSRLHTTAWTMIAAAGAGEGTARDEFARRYAPLIRTYLAARWQLPCTHERIDDAAQEVFVQCFKPSGALHGVARDGPGRFRTYLYGVVRHVAERIERGNGIRSRHVGGDAGVDELARNEASLSRVFDRAFVGTITRRAWLRMVAGAEIDAAGRDRIQILDLRFREGLASGAIADRTGFARDYVYQQLRRAKQDFRSALLEVVAELHPAASPQELEARCLELVQLL